MKSNMGMSGNLFSAHGDQVDRGGVYQDNGDSKATGSWFSESISGESCEADEGEFGDERDHQKDHERL